RGQILNTHSSGSISSVSTLVGHFVGRNAAGTGSALIELCSAIGNVTQDRSGIVYLGGFIGSNDVGSIIKESYYIGDVDNTNADTNRRIIGGFVGSNRLSSQIVNCYAWGTVR